MVVEGMALAAVLPDGDLIAGHAGRAERLPDIGMDQVGVGGLIVLVEAGGHGPDQALAEDVGVVLTAAAELMVEIEIGVGIGAEAGGIAVLDQGFGKAFQIGVGHRQLSADLQEDGGSGGNAELGGGDDRLFAVDGAVGLEAEGVFVVAVVQHGNLTALTVQEVDFLSGHGVFAADVAAPVVGLHLVAGGPFELGQVVLEERVRPGGGVHAEEHHAGFGCARGRRSVRLFRSRRLNIRVHANRVSACHNE